MVLRAGLCLHQLRDDGSALEVKDGPSDNDKWSPRTSGLCRLCIPVATYPVLSANARRLQSTGNRPQLDISHVCKRFLDFGGRFPSKWSINQQVN